MALTGNLIGEIGLGSVILFNTSLMIIRDVFTRHAAEKLQQTADSTKKTVDITHQLVNSQSEESLRREIATLKLLILSAERLAEVSKADADMAAVGSAKGLLEEAKQGLQRHLIKQAKADQTG